MQLTTTFFGRWWQQKIVLMKLVKRAHYWFDTLQNHHFILNEKLKTHLVVVYNFPDLWPLGKSFWKLQYQQGF
jgi:hypothetical protein